MNRISVRSWLVFLSVIVTLVFLDQFTKLMVLKYLSTGDSYQVIPNYFNLGLTYNRGAAFGLLAQMADGPRQLILSLTTTLALSVVFYFLHSEYSNDRTGQFALAMIVGGALGNIVDRLRLGMVVDFLDFYLGDWHWPAFNVADSAICIAVFILLLHKPKKQPADILTEQ